MDKRVDYNLAESRLRILPNILSPGILDHRSPTHIAPNCRQSVTHHYWDGAFNHDVVKKANTCSIVYTTRGGIIHETDHQLRIVLLGITAQCKKSGKSQTIKTIFVDTDNLYPPQHSI